MGFAESKYDGWLDKHFTENARCRTILELGCGWGDDTSFLAKTNHKIISCDYSEDAIRRINERYPNVATKIFDLREHFPFDASAADIVIASLCLHFFAENDMSRILAEIKRVLKKDGMFLCRLNSDNGRMRDIAGEIALESGLYMTSEGLKRFYNEDMIKNVFRQWNIKSIKEYETEKFSKRKILFEVVMTPQL